MRSPSARFLAIIVVLVVGAGCVNGGTSQPQADPAEFERDISGAVQVAEEYWQGKFSAAGVPFQPIRKIIAYRDDGEVLCGSEPLTRNNAAYCPTDDFIAYDVNWAAQQFVNIGDAFLYFLLGHEYAHGVQVRFGVQYLLTISQELQADCLAGAYIGDSVRAGRLELQQGDLDELKTGLVAVADDPGQPWFAPGSHGNAMQRTTAFFSGYQSSIPPCGLAGP
jgi:predicted metalloprotease